jgi:hypothetical protein
MSSLGVNGLNDEKTTRETPFKLGFDVAREGEHVFTYNAQDNAGNTETGETEVEVDQSQPRLTLQVPDALRTSKDYPLLSGTVSGTADIASQSSAPVKETNLKVFTGDTPNTKHAVHTFSSLESFSEWKTTSLEDGLYTIVLTARDAAGNQARKTQTVEIDNTAPQLKDKPAVFEKQKTAYMSDDTWQIALTDAHEMKVLARFQPQSDHASNVTLTAQETEETEGTWHVPINRHGHDLPEGSYTARIIATDAAGNTERDSSTPIVVDQTAPHIKGLDMPSSVYSELSVSGTVSDAYLPEEALLTLRVGELTKEVALNENGTWNATLDVSALDPGEQMLRMELRDRAGNIGSQRTSFGIDAQPPELTVTQPNENSIQKSLTVKGELQEQSGVKKLSLEVRSQNTENVWYTTEDIPVSQSWSVSVPNKEMEEEEPFRVRVRAEDQVGNTQITEKTGLRLDTTAPRVSFEHPSAQTVVNGDVKIRSQVTDNLDTKVETWSLIAKHQESGQEYAFSTLNPTWQTDTAEVADGRYTLELEASDQVGNQSKIVTRTLTVDNTNPGVTVSEMFGIVRDTLSVEGRVTEKRLPENSSVSVQIKSRERAVSIDANGVWQAQLDMDSFAEGTHTLQAHVADRAGNVGTSSARTFRIDRTAPKLTVERPQNASVTEDLTVTGDVTEKQSTLETLSLAVILERTEETAYQIEKERVEEGTWQVAVPKNELVEGEAYTVRVTAADTLENTVTKRRSEVRVDDTAPQVAVTDPVSSPQREKTLSEWEGIVEGTATDAETDISEVEMKIRRASDGAVWTGEQWINVQSPSFIMVDGKNTWKQPINLTSHGETYLVSVRSRDAAGNTSQLREYTVVHDPYLPALDFGVEGTPVNAKMRHVSWKASSYSGMERITLVADHRSSEQELRKTFSSETREYRLSELSAGAWELTLKAHDTAGNTQTATKGFEIAYGPHQFSLEDDVASDEHAPGNGSEHSEQGSEEQSAEEETEMYSPRQFAIEDNVASDERTQENGSERSERASKEQNPQEDKEVFGAQPWALNDANLNSGNTSGEGAESSMSALENSSVEYDQEPRKTAFMNASESKFKEDGAVMYQGRGEQKPEPTQSSGNSLQARVVAGLFPASTFAIGAGLLILLGGLSRSLLRG